MKKAEEYKMSMTKKELQEQARMIDSELQEFRAQEKKLKEAKAHWNKLDRLYSPDRTYLQSKEVDEAKEAIKEHELILKDLRKVVDEERSIFRRLELIRDFNRYIDNEVARASRVQKREEEVYKAFAKALDLYSDYKELIAEKIEDEIKEVVPDHYVGEVMQGYSGKMKLNRNQMAMISLYKEDIMMRDSYVEPIYVNTTTLDNIKANMKKKDLIKKRPIYRGTAW